MNEEKFGSKHKTKSRSLIKLVSLVVLLLVGFYLGANKDTFFPWLIVPNIESDSTVSAKELDKKLDKKDFTLINVHMPYEGEIEKTDLFINYDSLLANKNRLPEDKDTEIIIYCKSGNMSEQALSTLTGMGYTNVRHLRGGMNEYEKAGFKILNLEDLSKEVLPENGVELPVAWGDIGPKLISAGVIDRAKFEEIMDLTDEQKEILVNGSERNIKIDHDNSRFVVNMLWALGLAQKSTVYTDGLMGKEYKDSIGNFASTGGWTLSRGEAVSHLGMHEFIPLTEEQHRRVMEIAKNVYRPCCGNHTWFPDCNHGMAALAAIQLMVSAEESDEQIYKNILALNLYWFPSTYMQIATHFARQGTSWTEINAKEVLGNKYSSGKGASEFAKKVGPLPYQIKGISGSCGA